MYIVVNLTNRTVVLSDIRAEIRPKQVIDLERVTTRSAIDDSSDLKQALSSRTLSMVKYTKISSNVSIEKQVQPPIEKKEELSADKIAQIVRQVMSEQPKQQPSNNSMDETMRAVKSSVGELFNNLRDQLNNVNINTNNKPIETTISPEKLAEIQQKSIEKLSKDIEGGGSSTTKTINIINRKKLNDIAEEL